MNKIVLLNILMELITPYMKRWYGVSKLYYIIS